MSSLKKISTTGKRLREYMEMNNLKQVDIVNMTKLNKSVISLYLSDKREPMQSNIQQIAEALNVSPAWLMGLDVDMKASEARLQEVKSEYKKEGQLNLIRENEAALNLALMFLELQPHQQNIILSLAADMALSNSKQQ